MCARCCKFLVITWVEQISTAVLQSSLSLKSFECEPCDHTYFSPNIITRYLQYNSVSVYTSPRSITFSLLERTKSASSALVETLPINATLGCFSALNKTKAGLHAPHAFVVVG
jgi:hypothetical protein